MIFAQVYLKKKLQVFFKLLIYMASSYSTIVFSHNCNRNSKNVFKVSSKAKSNNCQFIDYLFITYPYLKGRVYARDKYSTY